MAYGIGPISGCHINPAVSLGVWVSGRMSLGDMIQYIIAQIAGAIVATLALSIIASGSTDGNFAANAMQGEFSITSGLLFEVIATFLFVVVILGATQSSAPASVSGVAIGLMLVAIHLIGIPITNTSVNPARSIGPALFQGGVAMSQLWVFIIGPMIGAFGAGLLFRMGLLETD